VRHQLEDAAPEALRLGAFRDAEGAAEDLLVRVLLDERQPELLRQRAGERRLPGPGRAGDDYESRRLRTYWRIPP
jgi:hypothetical protein